MDGSRFDRITRFMSKSRRSLLGGGLVAVAGLFGMSGANAKKRRKKKRKPKKSKSNVYGCLTVGVDCTSEEQCCSGVCEGKKGKRTCRAHDTSICEVDSDICAAGQGVVCGINNANCLCVSTTGGAPFCGGFSGPAILCRDCSQETDCEQEFGLGAACVVLGGVCASYCPHTGGTSCLPACNDSAE